MDNKTTHTSKPWYYGHRERMAKRIEEKGVETLSEDELLEQILMRALPRKDVKPIVRALMAEHKNLAGVFGASKQEWMEIPGISRNTANFLGMVRVVAQKLALGTIKEKPILSDWERLLDYVNALYTGVQVEVLYVFYLDTKLRLIKSEKQYVGTTNHVPIYPKEILKKALDENASKVVLVHNHPSGEAQPSMDDIRVTEQIAQLLAYSDIELMEHLIVGTNRHVHSMRAQGILHPLKNK